MPVKKRSRLRKSRRQVYKMEFVHKSVLFAETVAAMQAAPGKWLVDGTAGGGGHARVPVLVFAVRRGHGGLR